MKLHKQEENEVLAVYDTWLNSYLSGDIKTYDSYLDKEYRFIGSTSNEEFLNKKDTTNFLKATADQLAGKTQIRNSIRTVEKLDGLVFITDLLDAYFLNGTEWAYYGRFRFTSALRKKKNGWRFVYQHFSNPDAKAQEGETLGTEQITKENQELRDAIKRRTIELEQKNEELKIEAALERVRARAMGMQNSSELAELVDTVFKELTQLDFQLGWCMINIIDAPSLSNTVWTINAESGQIPEAFHMKFEDYPFHDAMMEGYKERATKYIYVLEGDEKKEYDEYIFHETAFKNVPKEAQAASRAMEKYVCSFTFCNFGGLQTVSDKPLSDINLEILARFGKVFDLTYTRFNDLLLAEEQTREAKIEVALERVRARMMAMHKSEELREVVATIFNQLQILGLNAPGSNIIIYNEDLAAEHWMTGFSDSTYPESYKIPYVDHPYFTDLLTAWQNGVPFQEFYFEGDLKLEYARWCLEHSDFKRMPLEFKKEMLNPDRMVISDAFNKHGMIEIIGSEPLPEKSITVLKRVSIVFEQTYTRFLDLQKAEAQAREAQIEGALERVRSRSMAMHRSEELADLSLELVKQVQTLGVDTWFCAFNIYDDDQHGSLEWGSNGQGTFPEYRTPREGIFLRYYEAGQGGETLLVNEIGENECPAHYEYLCSLPDVGAQLLKMKDSGIPFPTSQIDHVAYFKFGYILFITFEPAPQAHDIFKRFAKVFEQTYTRFLDLQKAEAQAREAEIQLAMERVRARTLAMHQSDEFPEAANNLFLQVQALGIPAWSAGYCLWENDKTDYTCIMSSEGVLQKPMSLPSIGTGYDFKTPYSEGKKFHVEELRGEEVTAHYDFLLSLPDFRDNVEQITQAGFSLPTFQVFHCVYFSHGFLLFITYEPVPEQWDVFNRFGRVFQQTFNRFLDLQKAEAQAREAQIEAALERIRAKTMAMHQSDELKEVVKVIFDQLAHLGINAEHAGIVVDYEPEKDWHFWIAETRDIPAKVTVPYLDLVWDRQFMEAKKKGKHFFTTQLDFEEKNSFYKVLLPHIEGLTKKARDFYFDCPGLAASTVIQKDIGLYIENFSGTPYTREENEILMRFGNVFQQTYTRFLDLKKAEVQAREAQIEVALERVRSRTLAMQKSDELAETAAILFQQLIQLGIEPNRLYIGIIKDNSSIAEFWTTEEDGTKISTAYTTDLLNNASFKKMYDAWSRKEKSTVVDIHGQELKEYIDYLSSLNIPFKDGMKQTRRIQYLAYFAKGFIGMAAPDEQPKESMEILERFAYAFNLTFTRFNDLKKAEIRARESQIETALERVRSRTMGMQQSEELGDVATVLFNEMNGLVDDLWTCGFVLCEENRREDEWWLSMDTGFTRGLFLPNEGDFAHETLYEGWQKGISFRSVELDGKKLNDHYEWLMKIPVAKRIFAEMETSGIPRPKWQKLHAAYFKTGYLVIITEVPCDEEEIFKRFAHVFDLTYTRFLDLQQKEEQGKKLVEEKLRLELTLKDLQATQSQLIQSEKMASLGELTAGIAHEIQNPLNFVNNFSEVSNELIDEMNEEMEKGDIEEAKEIAADIKLNLEKINHHGKRADAIVKGMLQHSRSSSGQKEPTDLNALCDEYLRLAYHGLRAKDKSFNATMNTDFDLKIGNINVVPQDMGRVVLNLITNAFYAVNEKKKSGIADYEPTVWISTKGLPPPLGAGGGTVEISVKDNGNGIPEKVKEKIFQPFFTTKPTGQGTGLGLSLSYDIVKAHGGELKVETKDGEGSEFSINLPIL